MQIRPILTARLVAVLVGLLVLLTFSLEAGPPGASATSVGKVYWIDVGPGADKILRSNLDGSQVEELVSEEMGGQLVDIPALAVDSEHGRIYWTNPLLGEIRRAGLDGSGVNVVVTLTDLPGGLAVDPAGGKLYWGSGTSVISSGKIERSDLDGSNRDEIVSTSALSYGVAVHIDGGHIYWGELHEVWRASLDGTNPEFLFNGPPLPGLIVFPFISDLEVADGPDVYWTVEHPAVEVCGGPTTGCFITDEVNAIARKLAGSPTEKLGQVGSFGTAGIAVDEDEGSLYSGFLGGITKSNLKLTAPVQIAALPAGREARDIELVLAEVSPPVGGVSLDEELRALPGAASPSFESGSGPLVAGATIVGVAALAGTAWWARRRLRMS